MRSMPQLESAIFVENAVFAACSAEAWRITLVRAAGQGLYYSAVVAAGLAPDVAPSAVRLSLQTAGEREAFDRGASRYAEVAPLFHDDAPRLDGRHATILGPWLAELVAGIPRPPPPRPLTEEEVAEREDDEDQWRQAWVDEANEGATSEGGAIA